MQNLALAILGLLIPLGISQSAPQGGGATGKKVALTAVIIGTYKQPGNRSQLHREGLEPSTR